jgi:hypothetical protein
MRLAACSLIEGFCSQNEKVGLMLQINMGFALNGAFALVEAGQAFHS